MDATYIDSLGKKAVDSLKTTAVGEYQLGRGVDEDYDDDDEGDDGENDEDKETAIKKKQKQTAIYRRTQNLRVRRRTVSRTK